MADLRGIIDYDYDATGDDYPERIWLAEGITEATAAGVIYDLTAEVERLTALEAELRAALVQADRDVLAIATDGWDSSRWKAGEDAQQRIRTVLNPSPTQGGGDA